LLFGAKTEKTRQVFAAPASAPPPPAQGQAASAPGTPAPPRHPGHGRIPAADYAGAKRVPIPHPKLREGDPCPECKGGKLYLLKHPAQLVRITAQPLFAAVRYELQKLRCKLCGQTFTAPAPPEAAQGKYAPEVGATLGYVRFGNGLPHYRLERMQAEQKVPLPASTQWELMHKAGQPLEPVQDALITLAAQGQILHNDDTTMRVQSLAKEATAPAQAKEGVADPQAAPADKERSGIFTTGIVSEVDGHRIALFLTGHHHAGENLDQVLARRAAAAPPPIQMCDALSRNPSKEFQTILANCLAHARRQFVDIAPNFPQECQHVLESLGQVYKNDTQAKEQALSPEARLRFHQQHSQEIMDGLHQWMKAQLEQKLVEPNSGLGNACNYMLKHWGPLTLFLRKAGAPLDNNVCERALKMAILHRKNSLAYKTQNGARLGDRFMSLIHTCRLCGANPLNYLNTLQHHAKEVREQPMKWLPWNYKEALSPTDTS
jgi:transposase